MIDRHLLLAISCVLGLIVLLFSVKISPAQDHNGHRPQDIEIHERFYSTWMMPDNPRVSCCHKQDCQPAASKFEDGSWWAKWEGMTRWIKIPANKVEQNRESPDGRSHMCGRPYGDEDFGVYCFVRGGGV